MNFCGLKKRNMKKITGKNLLEIGFDQNKIIGDVLQFCTNYKGKLNRSDILIQLKKVLLAILSESHP